MIVLRVPVSFCAALTFLTGVSGSEGAPWHPAGADYFSAVQTANTCWMTWWRLAAALLGFALVLLMKNKNWPSLVLRDDGWTNVSSSDCDLEFMSCLPGLWCVRKCSANPELVLHGFWREWLWVESRASPVEVGGWETPCRSEMALLIAESNPLPAPANVIKDVFWVFMTLL